MVKLSLQELAKELLKGLVKALTKKLALELDGKMAKWQGLIDCNENGNTGAGNGEKSSPSKSSPTPPKPRRGSVTQRNPLPKAAYKK